MVRVSAWLLGCDCDVHWIAHRVIDFGIANASELDEEA